jgi:hypothetical protein
LRAADKPPLNMDDLPEEYWLRGDDGAPVFGPNGKPMLDSAKVYRGHSFIGADPKLDLPDVFKDNSQVMIGAGKIPGMNAMAFFHDKWVATWNMSETIANQLTIPPAIVLTYMGTDSHVLEEIRKAALAEAAANAATLPKPVPAVLAVPPPAAPKPAPKPKPKPPRDRPDPPGANR